MLPLWHQEVLIMMVGGMERVPSDTSNDLNFCSCEQVRIHTYTLIETEGLPVILSKLCPT